ncbi:hypothetical protein [Kitasatospora sp. A2-31]|uniref:hypothetical protein n=1 Tax=Kitasatospora sp. A2-31 TaxID=2916414 RepID=UPI001EEEB2EE|nr:hypothetical protein [Kitasatospora sp. A2-31]MCG6499472.1 hypothetical protein [Kitasatospora sp. A2-31]
MRTVSTLVALTPQQLTTRLDELAAAEYLAGRCGQLAPPQVGQPAVYGELWLMAVARIAIDPGEYIVYAITSEDDVPGWPYRTGQYTGGIRTAADIARPLAAAGCTVALRHYGSFGVTSTAADVPLT